MDFVDVDSAKFEAYAAKSHGPMGWVHGREGAFWPQRKRVWPPWPITAC
jgi:hypothetical protein